MLRASSSSRPRAKSRTGAAGCLLGFPLVTRRRAVCPRARRYVPHCSARADPSPPQTTPGPTVRPHLSARTCAPPEPRPPVGRREAVYRVSRLSARVMRLGTRARRVVYRAPRSTAPRASAPLESTREPTRAASHVDSTPRERVRASVLVAPARVSMPPSRARADSLSFASRSNFGPSLSGPLHGIRARG